MLDVGGSAVIIAGMNTKILIVDDEAVNRQVLANYLKDNTFKITQVVNGPDALEVLKIKKIGNR